MSQNQSKQGFGLTLWRSLTLNASLYEDACHTAKNDRLALTIVMLAALSHLLGNVVILLINRASGLLLLTALLADGLVVVAGYYVWTFIIWKVGQWLKPIDPTYSDLLSPIGFAYAPQVLNFFTLIPLLGQPIELILAVWSLLAVLLAVRQGLDISTPRAALICLLGWVPIQVAIGFLEVLEQRLVTVAGG